MRPILSLVALALALPACHRESIDSPERAKAKLESLASLAAAHAAGQRTPPRFPMSSPEWTPSGEACRQPDGTFARSPGEWARQPWSDLGFMVDGKTRYQFRVTRAGADKSERYIVEARTDRNCNGVFAAYTILVDASGRRLPLRAEREDE